MNPDRYRLFVQLLENWFSKNKRDFPWRNCQNPYFIWISEIMSHQTQIERVAEKFFPKFIEKFPTVQDLAVADWSEVFPVWDGLGYYQRGKNMIKTAKWIVEYFHGEFPKSLKKLEELPGIGPYTAAAILAFAFDEKIPAIDTNISKIVRCLWPDFDVIKTSQYLVKCSTSGNTWNSAMMDLASFLRMGKEIEGFFGETFFPPEMTQKFVVSKTGKKSKFSLKANKPTDLSTSVHFTQKKCVLTSNEIPNDFPIIFEEKQKIIEVGIACIWESGKYLIQSRPEGKSFVGFWEFPGGKREKGETFRECVKREVREEIGVSVSVRPHFYEEIFEFKEKKIQLCLRFHRCQIQSGTPVPLEKQKLQWISPENFFDGLPFLATNQNALRILQKMKV